MELKITKRVTIDNARIKISFSPENDNVVMTLEYTCPKCAGWSCNKHSQNNDECHGGSVITKVDPDHLEDVFQDEQLDQVRKNLHRLAYGKA